MGLSISVTEAEVKRRKQRALRQQQKKLDQAKNYNRVGAEIMLKSQVINPVQNIKKQEVYLKRQQEAPSKIKNLLKTDYQSQMMRQHKGKDNFQQTKQTVNSSNLKTGKNLNQTFNLGPIQFANIDQLKQRSRKLRTEIKQQMQECRMNNRLPHTQKASRSLIYDNEQHNYQHNQHFLNCQIQQMNVKKFKEEQSTYSNSKSQRHFKRSQLYAHSFQVRNHKFQQSANRNDIVRIRNF